MNHHIVAASADNYPWAVCSCGRAWSYMDPSIRDESQTAQWGMVFGAVQQHVQAESSAADGGER